MSQVPLPRSLDTPPRTLPDELVKALQTDAFQHFLEHEAEKRIVAVLKRLSIVAVVVLGVFGWKAAELWGSLQDAKKTVEDQAREVKERAAAVNEQWESIKDAGTKAKTTAAEMKQSADRAAVSAQVVGTVEGRMRLVSETLEATAKASTETAQSLLTTATTTGNTLNSSTRELAAARNEIDTLRADLRNELKNVGQVSQAVDRLYRTSVLQVAVLRDHTERPFELPDPGDPSQVWRLVFRTGRMGLTKPWRVDWSHEKLSASGSRPVASREPLSIDRTTPKMVGERLEGTPFWYRVDMAYHSFFAEDFIVLSIYAPERTAVEASN